MDIKMSETKQRTAALLITTYDISSLRAASLSLSSTCKFAFVLPSLPMKPQKLISLKFLKSNK
ncbi:hypothetical protein GQX74_003011 [Glossina fuscipes]|nr:hypothetical protein GQX74_003011 [Glossina fuscipes]